jgi:hypothetical protein
MNTPENPSPSPRRPGRAHGAALLLSTLLAVLPATAQELQRTAPDGTWMRIVEGRDGAVLETSTGTTEALPLTGAVLNDLRRQGERYWITGVENVDGPRLVLLEGRDRSVTRGGELPVVQKALAWEPTLLLDASGPETLLWFESEGQRDQVLLTARRVGDAWGEPEVVSPRRAGSQMALTAVRLDDGSLLAAWAAFDGQDTDILYSRRENGRWSKPQAVTPPDPHNDITPKLLATRGGALLAWSRATERQYRVLISSYRGGFWQLPLTLGTAGTVYPTFQEGAEPVLLFQHAVPAAWEVLRLGPNGGLRDRGRIVTERDAVPVVESVDDEGALLSWPAEGVEKRAGRERVVWDRH